MPNIFHQSVEDILKAATPEQKILWNEIFLRFGERCSISQYMYYGTVGTGECFTYVARKMYFALSLLGGYLNNELAGPPYFVIYNENNVANMSLNDGAPYWDATAASRKYQVNSIDWHNLLFSRIESIGHNHYQFIGYRITY